VHPNTVLGAAIHGDGLLTDHGVDHIQMVMRNAYLLLKDKFRRKLTDNIVDRLNGSEVFILLMATHLHDVGNIYGREEHERKIFDVISEIGDRWTLDTAETLVIEAIATAHGGHAGDDTQDKDTLCLLNREDYLGNIPIRPALLASILRFADELSDDNTRANRFLNNAGVVLDKNKIHHEYSCSLSPITITGNVVAYKYFIGIDKTHNKIPLGNGENAYLYDEILKRLKKCLCELEYCRKYADGLISITTLNAIVNIMPEKRGRPVKTTEFNLRLRGYPTIDSIIIDSLEYMSGEELNNAIQEVGNDA
jgi:hypothetical protein